MIKFIKNIIIKYNIKQAMKDVQKIKSGKIKPKTYKQLLTELENK
jgi:hypothetical protein